MTLDKRGLEILSAVLTTYADIAGMVDESLRDEVVFLRNKLQLLQRKMTYEGYGVMACD